MTISLIKSARALCSLIALLFSVQAHANQQKTNHYILSYDKEASSWQAEALPIGNGQLGAMIFSGVDKERIQFNEETLWSGSEQQVGFFQSFGELLLYFNDQAYYSCESAHDSQDEREGENITKVHDAKLNTKWVISPLGNKRKIPVIYQAFYPFGKGRVITSYSLSAAQNHRAKYTPTDWSLQASQNGRQWIELDKKSGQPGWDSKVSTRSYVISNQQAYRYYRLVFPKSFE